MFQSDSLNYKGLGLEIDGFRLLLKLNSLGPVQCTMYVLDTDNMIISMS